MMASSRTLQDLLPLLELSPVALMVTHLGSGRIVALNRRCELEFQLNAGECVGKTTVEMGLWNRPSERSRFSAALHDHPDGIDFDVPVRIGDGDLRTMRISARVVNLGEDGLHVMLAAHDLEPMSAARSREVDLLDRQLLLESLTTDVVARIGPDGSRRYTSPAIKTLLGYTPAELEGTSPFEHFHPDDVPALKQVFHRLLTTGETETATYRSRRKDGSYIWVETLCSPLRDPDTGGILEVRTSTRDITARRAAEEDLRRSEELHRKLIASLSEGVILLDSRGVVFQANERAHEILHVPVGVLLGVSLDGDGWTYQDQEGNPVLPADLPGSKTLVDGQTRRSVVVGVQTPGGLVWINQSSSIVSNPSDPSEFILLVSFTDVTERVSSERALRDSEAHMRMLSDMSQDMISRHGLDGSYLWASPASRTIVGLDTRELEGRSAMDFIHPDDRPLVESQLVKIFETHQTRTRFRIVHPDGEQIWVETIAVLVKDPASDAPLEIHCTTRDIREQKRQEELVASTQRIARLGGWEHDFSTDLVTWTRELYLIHEMDPDKSGPLTPLQTLERLDEDSVARVTEASGPLLKDGVPWTLILRGVSAKGNPMHLNCTSEPIYRNGQMVGLRGTVQDVTEIEKVRERLESADSMNRAILDTSEALIVVLDRRGQVVRFNQACEKATGWTESELLGKPFFEVLIPGEEREHVSGVFRNLRSGSFPNHHANHWIDRRGNLIWTAWANSAILGRDGEVEYVVGIGIDMTAHRAMQIELQESEARLRCLIDTAPDAIVILDAATGRFIDVNPAAENLYGLPRWKLLELGPIQLSPPKQPSGRDSAEAAMELVGRSLAGEFPLFDWVHLRADGTEVLCEIHLSRLPSDGRDLVRGSIVDVSQRRKTESVVESLVRGTASVFGQAFFDVLVKDLSQILGVRHAFIARIEEARGSVSTISICSNGDLAANLEFPLAGSICHDVLRDGPVYIANGVRERFPDSALHRDLLTESFMGVPLYSSSKEPIGFLVVLDSRPMPDSDLARSILTIFASRAQGEMERLEAENRLRALNLELESRVLSRTQELVATNRELEAFSYSVSHDLRSPLRAIDGFTQAIQEDYASQFDETGHHYLSRIRLASHRMADLIDDLLSLSRSSRVELRIQRVDLTAMATEIMAGLSAASPERTLEFRLDRELEAEADPVLLRSALENLLENAWKYSRHRPSSRIEFRKAPAPDGFAGFSISDNGAGFDMAHEQKLFGTFQRLHGNDEFEGNGIGLATVRRILERHGGSIQARGVVDGGATFLFQLPIQSPREPSPGSLPIPHRRD